VVWEDVLSQNIDIQIVNLLGEVVLEAKAEKGSNGISIVLKDLPTGIYLMKIENKTHKIWINR